MPVSTRLTRFSSLGDMLHASLATHESGVALIEADRDQENIRYTFREFSWVSSSLAKHFSQTLRPGDHAAILMSNQSKWLLSATAIFWSGAVLVPLDYKLTPKEQLELLAHSDAKLMVIEWGIYSRWIKEGFTPPSHVRVIVSEVPEKNKSTLSGVDFFETLVHEKADFSIVPRSQADVACLVYSSGTGGIPKGCMLTHGNYLAQAEALARMFPIRPVDRYFSVLPTNHAIDFMCGFLLPLFFGSAVVHQRTLRPEYLATTMKTYKISHMALVPMLLKAFEKNIKNKIAEAPVGRQKLLSILMKLNRWMTSVRPCYLLSKKLFSPIHAGFGGHLRLLFAGGSFVEAELAEFFYSLGLPVVIGYGLTEAGTVLTVNDLKPFRSDTVGKALQGTHIDIRQPNESGVGEVWVKGPTVMKGYYKSPELTDEAIIQGWLRTGDMGFFESTGHLKLLGRTKNMIVTEGGKNVYPEDVEALLGVFEELHEYAIFSSSYIWSGTKLTQEKLILVARLKEPLQKKDFLIALQKQNQKLSDYKRIHSVVLWDKEFPRTASMKVKRHMLAAEIAANPHVEKNELGGAR